MKALVNSAALARDITRICLGVAALAGLSLGAAAPAQAQSLGIGLNFAEVSAWSGSDDTVGSLSGARITGDFRTGPANGVQVDLSGFTADGRFLGQIDLHFYLSPTDGRKYGFFASLADMDDQEFTTGTAGVEVMADIAPGTVIEARAGLGMMRGGALGTVDFVTLSGGLSHAISDRTSVFVQATVSEFQEQTISATGYEALAGIRHSAANGRIEVMAAVGTTGLWGDDSAPAEPAAYLGVTWRLSGATGQKRPASQRAFETWQPARPLMVLGRF